MSPVVKHRIGSEKEGDKALGKDWKGASRHSSIGAGMPTSAYKPGFGTFHILESSVPEKGMCSQSARFRSIDDSDDVGSVVGSYSEYDSMSNNGSCSGESEDQLPHLNVKDKKGRLPGVVGGASDKGEKIRYRNEKKHQRQKERRAQELRDRCMGYLMSRKLEALVQQLIPMGFSSDRATMALILNEGHVERSISWLLEGGEGQLKEDWNADGSKKIDISDELARIADLEIRFKYPRVEIERAIVANEGDLDKAAVYMRDRYPQITTTDSDYGNQLVGIKLKERAKEQMPSPGTPVASPQSRSSGLLQALNHQRRQESEFDTTQNKSQASQSSLSRSPGSMEGNLLRTAPHAEPKWPRSSTSVDGKLVSTGTRPSSQPVPLAQSSQGRQVPDSRSSPLDTGRSSLRHQTLHLSTRDPVITTHLSRSPITPPSTIRSASVSPSLSPTSWNGNTPGASSPSSVLFFNGAPGDMLFKSVVSGNSTGGLPFKDTEGVKIGQSSQPNGLAVQGLAWGNCGPTYGRRDNLPPVGVPPSTSDPISHSTPRFLSAWGSGLTGRQADWSTWVSSGCDYKTIDWSMGASPSMSSENSVWGGSSPLGSALRLSEGGIRRPAVEETLQGLAIRDEFSSSVNHHNWNSPTRGTSRCVGHQENPCSDSGTSTAVGIPEWTSPFAGKDLFTLPYQSVSPTLL